MITRLSAVSFPALGTTAVLVTEPAAADAARGILDAELCAIDGACSRFRDDSELVRLNAADGAPFPASPLLLEAVEVAIRAARVTGGRVDPTVGSTMRVLGYDRTFAEVARTGGPLQLTATAVPGWTRIRVDPGRRTVQLPPGVELDLGATAKALAADRAAEAVFHATGTGVLVGLGGDIATAGPPPTGAWTVLVTDDHATPLDGPGESVSIESGGLATSGTSVRRWMRGGQQLHHVIDPATGLPAGETWRTVSVAAACCVDANIASTASIVMGRGAADWLADHHLPARLVAADGAVTVVGGWPGSDLSPC